MKIAKACAIHLVLTILVVMLGLLGGIILGRVAPPRRLRSWAPPPSACRVALHVRPAPLTPT